MKTADYDSSGRSEGLPAWFVIVIFALLAAGVAINLIFAGKPWLDQFNLFSRIAGPVSANRENARLYR